MVRQSVYRVLWGLACPCASAAYLEVLFNLNFNIEQLKFKRAHLLPACLPTNPAINLLYLLTYLPTYGHGFYYYNVA